jgi:hypothetical protein
LHWNFPLLLALPLFLALPVPLARVYAFVLPFDALVWLQPRACGLRVGDVGEAVVDTMPVDGSCVVHCVMPSQECAPERRNTATLQCFHCLVALLEYRARFLDFRARAVPRTVPATFQAVRCIRVRRHAPGHRASVPALAAAP